MHDVSKDSETSSSEWVAGMSPQERREHVRRLRIRLAALRRHEAARGPDGRSELAVAAGKAVVREVLAGLRGETKRSFYDLWKSGRYGDGRKRTHICAKGTAHKIKRLYDQGRLTPYLAFIYPDEAILQETEGEEAPASSGTNGQPLEVVREQPEQPPCQEYESRSKVQVQNPDKVNPLLEKLRRSYSLPCLRPTKQLFGVAVTQIGLGMDRHERLLLKKLKAGYEQESPLWGWMEAWEATRSKFEAENKRIEIWLRKSVTTGLYHFTEVQLTALFIPVLLTHALLYGTGEGGGREEWEICEQDGAPVLRLGKEEIPVASDDQDLHTAGALFRRLKKGVEVRPETKRAGQFYSELQTLQRSIHSEIDALIIQWL